MNEITVKFDGVSVQAKEGESLLNVARANGIYIPAICYLTRTSASLACKLCMVEADGKRVYACNAKVKDGMEVTVDTPDIVSEREAIMEAYCVNHPLQCGVCDKSGECELQDNTMFQEVSKQDYAIKDTPRNIEVWGNVKYDGALCIMCKRCITVCKDMIGDDSLTTVSRGGDPVDEVYKESMPKDAFGIWKMIQKNLIGRKNPEADLCTDCGECAAVCPTGALITTDFQYTSNAWELESIPSACTHCSGGCQLFYEVKPTSISNQESKIYRVKNDFHFTTLCGAGRFGYDFENRARKDENKYYRAVEAFKKAESISFSSIITNEEALILQKIKEKLGVKLVNPEAKSYQNFLKEFGKTSGKSLYSGNSDLLRKSDFVISVGSNLKSDSPGLRFALNNAVKMNKGAAIYFHPIHDAMIDSIHKNVLSVIHPAGKEEAIFYYLLDKFADREKLPKDIVEYLDSFKETKTEMVTETVKEKVKEIVKETVTNEDGSEEEVEKEVTKEISKEVEKEVTKEINRLYDEMGVYITDGTKGDIEKLIAKKEKYSLIVGEDVFNHPRAKNIGRLVGLIQRTTIFDIIINPPKMNTLGVSLICDLDDEATGYTVGYNSSGDFRLTATGAKGDSELDMPAMNQQEGTVTSRNKRVVPVNPAVDYNGYTLGNIANSLGIDLEYTVDLTPELPIEKGFKRESFDTLPDVFEPDGTENRGYLLNETTHTPEDTVEKIAPSKKLEGTVVYRCNPVKQFNEFTAQSEILSRDPQANGGWADNLYVNEQFLTENTLADGDKVKLVAEGKEQVLTVLKGDSLEGKMGLVPDFLGSTLFDKGDYRFKEVTIERMN